METFLSDLSHREYPVSQKISAKTVRHSLLCAIQQEHPNFTHDSSLSLEELNYYREKTIADYLRKETGELSELEKKVLVSLKDHSTLTDKVDDSETRELTVGQKIADKVASFGGSWTFILIFLGFLLLWICANVFILLNHGFDPYPFILLNLILSCIAAIQAPVIMMSQNRQEEKDRNRSKNDYMINLKSELEIRTLHEKIDHLIMDQQLELLELQKVQIDIMNDIIKKLNDDGPGS